MQDIVIRIREAIQARADEAREVIFDATDLAAVEWQKSRLAALRESLAIIDQECFRREPAEANE